MKKNKYILSLGLIILIAACTDILDTTPKSVIINDASFFKTTADFDAYILGAYIACGGSFDGSGVANWIKETRHGRSTVGNEFTRRVLLLAEPLERPPYGGASDFQVPPIL